MDGIRCAGAAVLDRRGYPVAGVTVIGPAYRMPESLLPDLGRRCRAAADEIARRIDA
jgi:IclR family acetate operon transcriptional repressor